MLFARPASYVDIDIDIDRLISPALPHICLLLLFLLLILFARPASYVDIDIDIDIDRLISPALPHMFAVWPRCTKRWIARIYREVGSARVRFRLKT